MGAVTQLHLAGESESEKGCICIEKQIPSLPAVKEFVHPTPDFALSGQEDGLRRLAEVSNPGSTLHRLLMPLSRLAWVMSVARVTGPLGRNLRDCSSEPDGRMSGCEDLPVSVCWLELCRRILAMAS